ncbi:MAG: hypothetical protein V7K68_20535 [Nostoc sp.]
MELYYRYPPNDRIFLTTGFSIIINSKHNTVNGTV